MSKKFKEKCQRDKHLALMSEESLKLGLGLDGYFVKTLLDTPEEEDKPLDDESTPLKDTAMQLDNEYSVCQWCNSILGPGRCIVKLKSKVHGKMRRRKRMKTTENCNKTLRNMNTNNTNVAISKKKPTIILNCLTCKRNNMIQSNIPHGRKGKRKSISLKCFYNLVQPTCDSKEKVNDTPSSKRTSKSDVVTPFSFASFSATSSKSNRSTPFTPLIEDTKSKSAKKRSRVKNKALSSLLNEDKRRKSEPPGLMSFLSTL